MMNLIDYMEFSGTSEGAKKGWDKRGRGLAKKNFEPASSVVHEDDKSSARTEAVKQAFGDALATSNDTQKDYPRNLHFSGAEVSPQEAAQHAELVPSYNDYKGKRVGAFLRANADSLQGVRFGREYSPVLYLRPKQGADTKQLMAGLKKLKADEVDMQNNDGTIRAWWD